MVKKVLDGEAQLLLAQKELKRIKQYLESSKTTKAKAFTELGNAKRTEHELTTKLRAVTTSKQAAMEAVEAVREQAKKLDHARSQNAVVNRSWKQELEHARKEYPRTVKELDSTKQELTKVRQDFDAALESKSTAFQQAAEAQRSANVNSDKVTELSKEIALMQKAVEQLKLASVQAQQEHMKIMAEKETHLQSYKKTKEEVEKKLISSKEAFDPKQTPTLEAKLKETNAEIEFVQEEMRKFHASKMETLRTLMAEISEATETLQGVSEEGSSLRNLLNSLKLELLDVQKQQDVLKDKEIAAEALASSLSDEIKRKEEEALKMRLQQILSETENAKQEAEKMKKSAEKLKEEAESTRNLTEKRNKTLEIALKEVEEAKAAERKAVDEMKMISEGHQSATQDENSSRSNSRIKLSVKDFESLSQKVVRSENLAEEEEANALAQVETMNARKIEAENKMEANLNAIEEIKLATDIAVKSAQSADSAKKAVEGELERWRQQEQREVAAAAAAPIPTSGHIYL